jgi:hypothetical protein
MSTWRSWAGREDGRDGYVFGDITRAILGTIMPAAGPCTPGPIHGERHTRRSVHGT